MSSSKLSVVIITYNEEANIGRCIESVKDIADELIIIDSGSTDHTIDIASSFSARIITKKWLGYSEQKNFGNQQAQHDMILSMDADEALSEELRLSILTEKEKGLKGIYGFSRLTNYCGKFIRHGSWYPDFKLRIFNRNQVKWEGYIHEKLTGYKPNEITWLKGDCLHYSFYSIEQHKAKSQNFSTMMAEDMKRCGKKFSMLKYFFSPAFKFLSGYVFKLGFLDGLAGFNIALISAQTTALKYKKLKKLG